MDCDGKLLSSDIATQIEWYASHGMLKGKLEASQVANTSFLEKALK